LESVSSDLQQVQVTMRVLSRPVESKLPEIYRKLGVDFDERVLPSIGNEVLKAVIVRSMSNIIFRTHLSCDDTFQIFPN
jgi:hypothetical protein